MGEKRGRSAEGSAEQGDFAAWIFGADERNGGLGIFAFEIAKSDVLAGAFAVGLKVEK